MNRTGSTYARRWPISWSCQLGRALSAALLLAAVSSAHANWEVKDVPGLPRDVRVWAPGVFSVTTSQGAYLFRADGSSVKAPAENSASAVGSYLASDGCFMAFWSNTNVTSVADCTSATPVVLNNDLAQTRISSSGAAYGLATDSQDALIGFSPPSSGGYEARPWGPNLVQLAGPPIFFDVMKMGASEHALVVTGSNFEETFSWLVNGTPAATYAAPGNPPFLPVQSIQLFSAGAPTPTALIGWGPALYRGTLISGSQPPFRPLALPSPPGTVTGVDVDTQFGSAYGVGFGMVTVQHANSITVLSAVPASQPQDIGTQWKINPMPPSMATRPRFLDCTGARFCVAAQDIANTGNLLLYTNASPPTLFVDPDTSLPEETSNRKLIVRASDPDGDALLVTVTPDTILDAALSMSTSPVEGGLDLTVNTFPVCADKSIPVRISASDGFVGHDQVRDVMLKVIHTRRAGAPTILPSPNIPAQAGAPAKPLGAGFPANPPCPLDHFEWTPVTQGAPALLMNGTSVSFLPPDVLCKRNGESYLYRLEAVDSSGLRSEPRYFSVQVGPWGTPLKPFSADRQEVLAAGSGFRLTPVNTHVCDVPSSGFPGVDTQWNLVAGKATPGVRLYTRDNVLVTGSNAVTPELRVETDECASGPLSLEVKHSMHDGSGIVGPVSHVQINVDPRWVPLATGVLKIAPGALTADRLEGTSTVEGLNCLLQRGLKIRLRLKSPDGTTVQQADFEPGPWEFKLPPVCLGAHYVLEAELLPNPNSQAEPLPPAPAPLQIDVPPVEVPLVASPSASLVVRCGEAATGILEQHPPAPCSSLPLSWQQISGPPLVQSSFTGQRIELMTRETDFGALLGQKVVMRVTADTGKVTQLDQEVSITAEPFLTAERHVENGVGTNTDLIGVSLELHNTTECGVSQLDQMERLVGMDYVPGSARFNGQPVEAHVEGELLTVQGMALEGSSTGQLTYVVRPKLLGGARFEGQSFVRGVPVSEVPEAPLTGCGCEGGGSGFTALGLAGLATLLRRRREVAIRARIRARR